MRELPDTRDSLVMRTDFSDDPASERLCRESEAPVGEFRADVSLLSDLEYKGLALGALTDLARRGPYRGFLFVVDEECLSKPEHPILVLDLADQPGRTFRVIPSEMWSVQNNLSLANMDFVDFAESVD